MCGVAGLLAVHGKGFPIDGALNAMSETLLHRGPDSMGIWSDPNQGIGLAHRRLSIVDLSPAGNQPMESRNQRFQIVFNGEIYNHLELRAKLSESESSIRWRGHSDTETLLECISAWGIEKTLSQLVGMFAFGLWDSKVQALILARDRFGEKPLYFGFSKGIYAFGSELKAFEEVPGFDRTISRESIALFMRFGYIPDPHSIYEEIQKLPPGTWVTISKQQSDLSPTPQPQTYWSAKEAALSGLKNQRVFPNDEDAVEELQALLSTSVNAQLMGDVPIGAFLSGGIDSSLISALMQSQSSKPINTFSIGFELAEFDEAPYAKAIASHLGTNHTELYVKDSDGLNLIPSLPTIYDEPFGDSSQIPTYLVSRLAREKVTVSLSGDAGDELFGGYRRYFQLANREKSLTRIPRGIRSLAANAITGLSPEAWDKILRFVNPLASGLRKVNLNGDRIHKAARVLRFTNSAELYKSLITIAEPDDLVLRAREPRGIFDGPWPLNSSLIDEMMLADTVTYLSGDILVKVDRASMANSLESRVPFLDHRIYEFAWQLPLHFKVRDGQSKWILRKLLSRHVPKELYERPKMGFGVPIGDWLRGSLRDWAESLIDPERLESEGFLNPKKVLHTWREHLSGRRNWQYALWNILMFQAWLDKSGDQTNVCETP